MKLPYLCVLFVSLSLIFSNFGFGQQIDSTSVKVPEQRIDSTIIKIHVKDEGAVYLMKGLRISKPEVKECLLKFPSSAREYEKSTKLIGYRSAKFWGPEITSALFLTGLLVGRSMDSDFIGGSPLYYTLGITISGIGLIAPFIYNGRVKHHHWNKALRLYNREMREKYK